MSAAVCAIFRQVIAWLKETGHDRGNLLYRDWAAGLEDSVPDGYIARFRIDMFLTMEGTLMGAFALVCVCIWNGCFNSIQVVCRERDVIKREHRSGMHISSYVFAHMLYQLLLCIFQTGITLYVIRLVGVQFPQKGLITPWMIVDIGISMLLITYASDMLSLVVNSITCAR